MIEVRGDRYYQPREVADLGLITNSKGKKDYRFILRLIEKGLLSHSILNPESQTPYYLISERSINYYLVKLTGENAK